VVGAGRDDVHRNAAPQQVCDVGMTQAVERNMGNAGGGSFAGELFRERTATKGAGADRVVVMVDGHNVPVQLSVNKVQKTGRSERDARYFLEAGGLMPGGFVETLGDSGGTAWACMPIAPRETSGTAQGLTWTR
jgi:hypothetical protein